jgi:hypothetical protein
VDLSTLIARLIDLRNGVIITPYDLAALAGTFLAERVTSPAREMGGLVREALHSGRLGREDRHGCQDLARTVEDLSGWCGLCRQFDCGPLEAAVTKLVRHNTLLRRLQQAHPRAVDGQCGEFAHNHAERR